MAASLHSESKRHLVWWDSHISAKNTKWLQDNLSDVDMKVKAMKKLINEDADSFARRAEMYYKKRPELMNLVEEFYKAYRALAERYHHATNALRQAHRAISEAFPNQIPVLSDDSPFSTSSHEAEPHTPEIPPPIRAPYDPDDLQKDAIGLSPPLYAAKRNGTDPDSYSGSEGGLRSIFFEGKARKGLSFEFDHTKELKGDDHSDEAVKLQQEIARLLTESKDLRDQLAAESEKASRAENENQSLKDIVSQLRSQKENAFSQHEESTGRISELESQLVLVQNDVKRLTEELANKDKSLSSAEEHNRLIQIELDELGPKLRLRDQDVEQKSKEVEGLQISLQEECQRCMRAEANLLVMEKKFADSLDEVNRLSRDIEAANENLNESAQAQLHLEATICELKEEVNSLKDANHTLRSEIQEHKNAVFDLKTEKEVALRQFDQSLKEVSKLEAEIAKAKSELVKAEENVMSLTQDLDQKTKEMQEASLTFSAKIEGHENIISRLKLEKEAVLAQLQQSLKQASNLDTELSIAKLEVLTLDEKFRHIEQELREKSEEAEVIRNNHATLNNDLSVLKLEKEAMLLQCQQVSERVLNLEAQHSGLKSDAMSFQEKISSLEDALEQKSKEEAEMRNQLENELKRFASQNEAALLQSEYISKRFELLGKEMWKTTEKLERQLCSFESTVLMHIATTEEELASVEQKVTTLEQELRDKVNEVTKLCCDLADEGQSRIKAEKSLQLMENLQSETQQEVSRLVCEIESLSGMLKEMENSKSKLENAAHELEEKISTLTEKNMDSELMNEDLRLEISSFKVKNEKLEIELLAYVGEKEGLQRDLMRHMEEKEHLELSHRDLTDKLGMISSNAEALQILIAELQRMNSDLKDTCDANDKERSKLLEKVKDVEELSDQHAALKDHLSDIIVDLETSAAKIGALEDLECSLKSEILSQIMEKTTLAVQVEALGHTVRELTANNSILGTTIHDLKAELEDLRLKLDNSEALCRSHLNHISDIDGERNSLLSQVESITSDMRIFEQKHEVLQGEYASLCREKELAHDHARELKDQLDMKHQQHEDAVRLHCAQLADLDSQISLLQERNKHMDEQLTDEQLNNMATLLRILVLEMSLSEAEVANASLVCECKKYTEIAAEADNQILLFKQEAENRQTEMEFIRKHNEKLTEGIYGILSVLGMKSYYEVTSTACTEAAIQAILSELKLVLDLSKEFEDNNIASSVNLAVLTSILMQTLMELRDVKLQNSSLLLEIEQGSVVLFNLDRRNQELLESNEKVILELQMHIQSGDMLRAEKQETVAKLESLNAANELLESKVSVLTQKDVDMSKEHQDLLKKHSLLEEHSSFALEELIMLDLMHMLIRNLSDERERQVKLMNDELILISSLKNELDLEVKKLKGIVEAIEIEKEQRKNSHVCSLEKLSHCLALSELDFCICQTVRDEQHLEMENVVAQLAQESTEALRAKEQCNEQCDAIEALQKTVRSMKLMKIDTEQKILALTEEISVKDRDTASLSEANEKLWGEVEQLQTDLVCLSHSEKYLASELEHARNESQELEAQFVSLMCDSITSTVNAAVYEEKIHEFIIELYGSEQSAVTQREVLVAEIGRRNLHIEGLEALMADMNKQNEELKSNLSLLPPLISSLSQHVASLEAEMPLLSNLHESNGQESAQSEVGSNSEMMILALQRLVAKVEAMPKALMRTKLEAANLDVKENMAREALPISKGKEHRSYDDEHTDDEKSSKVKNGLMIKDIELDQVSSSSPYGSGVMAGLDDEMLQLWEAAERDCKNGKRSSAEHDIQAVLEVRSAHPSSVLIREKELGVDRLETSAGTAEPPQEWFRKVQERLASDTRRLAVMRSGVEELKSKLEGSAKGKASLSSEYASIRAQLRRTEEVVSEQTEANSKLTRMAVLSSSSKLDAEARNDRRREALEQIQRGSEMIGKLEFELQKMHYLVSKLEEGEGRGIKVSESRSRVLLRDYIYGRKDARGTRKRKKISFCMCMRQRASTE